MGKQAEINKELATALRKAKTAPMFFAFVMKGAADGALCVDKKKIPPAAIADAKKSCGGTQVYKGKIEANEDGKLVFKTTKEPPATLAKAIKTVAQRDAGITIHPLCELSVDLEEEVDVEDSGDEVQTPPEAPPKPTGEQTPPKTPPKQPDLGETVKSRLKNLIPDYNKALAIVPGTVAGQLKTLHAGLLKYVEAKEYGKALLVIGKLETEIKTGLAKAEPSIKTAPKWQDLPEDFGKSMEDLFDEDAEPYKSKLDEVQSTYELACRIEPSLISAMSQIETLAEKREFGKAIAALDKLGKLSNSTLNTAAKTYAYEEREFGQYLRLAERLEALENQAGAAIKKLYTEAEQAALKLDYAEAMNKLAQGKALALPLQKKLDQEADRIRNETQHEKGKDETAFDFVSKTKDKPWGFDTDDDANTFFIGQAMGEQGQLVKSDKLKVMEEQTSKAIDRKDALLKSGATPEQAGEIAFANIPRNFWPDSVVREVLMYKRARLAFEAEKEAKLNVAEAQDLIDQIFDTEEAVFDKLTTLTEKLPDGDTIDEAKEKCKKLGELGFKKLAETGGKLLSSEQLKEAGEALGDFAEGFGYVAEGVGVLISGGRAIKSGLEASKIKDDPVRRKLVEFKRNKAIVETVNKLLDIGLGLEDIVPALGVAASGKEMVEEVTKAVMYFVKLAQIVNIKEDAKLDPETMMELPLARMARNQKVRASQATVNAVAALLKTAGNAVELGGVSAPAGLALTGGGKVIELGGKVIFKGISWADAKRCVKEMKAAAGPPPIRKAMTNIFKHSNRYAVYALAYGAVLGNDPWAIDYVVKQGLTEDDLKSPATSVEIVREYMLTTAGGVLGEEDEEEDDPTIRPDLDQPTTKDKGLALVKQGAEKVRDKIVGRDTSQPLNTTWRAGAIVLTRASWQEVKKGAIAAGWYDTRSGFGNFLTQYENAKKAFETNETAENADEFFGATRNLRMNTRGIGGLANDQKTCHDGMQDYKDRLYEHLDKHEDEIEVKRSRLHDVAKYGDKPPEEIEQLKQEELEQLVQKMQEEAEIKLEQRKAAIREYWDDRKHSTPYGNCTLPDFAVKAAETLGLEPQDLMPLAGAVIELSNECVDQLNSLLSGTPEEEFKRELERQAKQLDGSLVEGLRTIANLHYEAMKQRQGQDAETEEGEDDGTWKPTNFMLSSSGWKATKKDAIKNGLVDKSTGVGKAIETYEKAQANYQKNHDDEKATRLVNISLIKLREAFEAFQPLNRKKLPHQGMAAYRQKMLEKVRQQELAFQRERSLKQEAIANTPKKEFVAPNHTFTKSGWVLTRDAAIEDGMVDKKTGLPSAFSTFESAIGSYVMAKNSGNEKKTGKALEVLRKAKTELENKLNAFDPRYKDGRPHTGMQSYKSKMLVELPKVLTTSGVHD